MPLDVANFEAYQPENDPVIQVNVVCRHEAGWTHQEIARSSGLSHGAVNRIVNLFVERAYVYRRQVSGAKVKRVRWPS